MSNEDEKQMVYYVQNGTMKSGWILGEVTLGFDISYDSAIHSNEEMLNACFIDKGISRVFNNTNNEERIPKALANISKRPGTYYLISGYDLVHSDDCFKTKEKAAENYKQELLK